MKNAHARSGAPLPINLFLRMVQSIPLLLLVMFITGCASIKISRSAQMPPPPRTNSAPVLGLALSGGGIRSGAVSLGALQGLYQQGVLSNFTYVSAVSGGGYPVYGLLDQMLRRKTNSTLNDLLGESNKFIPKIDNQGIVASATTYLIAIPTALITTPMTWTRGYGSAHTYYHSMIHRAFTGRGVPFKSDKLLSDAAEIRADKGFPTPIFGAAASFGSRHQYALSNFFELSPTYGGSPGWSYSYDLPDKVTLGSAVTISAAISDGQMPYKSLRPFQKVLQFLGIGLGGKFSGTNSGGNAVRDGSFWLADGGFVENMGILPLLRRGCTDVLVFDNSEKDGPFDDWKKFADALATQEPGWGG